MLECDVVFEGGGVKGIGMVGAYEAFEKAGYKFVNVAGTSAGAIVAALVAAGYSAKELRDETFALDYRIFKGKDFLDKLGIVGILLSLLINQGIYNTVHIEKLLDKLLARKGVRTFGDLGVFENNKIMSMNKDVAMRTKLTNISVVKNKEKYEFGKNKCRLQITTVDLESQKILILPDDLAKFGIIPHEFSVAKAVCMSVSIPLFYEPYVIKCSCNEPHGLLRVSAKGSLIKKNHFARKHFLVDGGLLSNYPMFVLDDGKSRLRRPVFGIRLGCDNVECVEAESSKIATLNYVRTILDTMIDSRDNLYIENSSGDKHRSVFISNVISIGTKRKAIKTTDFKIKKEECFALYQNGVDATKKFINNWNFANWLEKYR